MRKIIQILAFLSYASMLQAQSDSTMQRFADSVCKCLEKVDINSIKTKNAAEQAITNCFLKGNVYTFMKLCDERGISVTDEEAINKLGEELGEVMFNRKCTPFVQLSFKLAAEEMGVEKDAFASTTSGTLTAVESKEFRKLILTEAGGRKNTYYWLHHFKNSEMLIDHPEKFIGKKMKITWTETEVFLPAAKGYFKIKEIKEIEIL